MTLTIRPGTLADLASATELLNAIVERGGTTAITDPVNLEDMEGWLCANPEHAAWHVAVDDTSAVLGFQWIGPWADLPQEATEIGTFVRIGQTGLGIGSKLFEATKAAARGMGKNWIRAMIRSDNDSGLTYYESRGFRTYDHLDNVTLPNGLVVGKTLKRFDL